MGQSPSRSGARGSAATEPWRCSGRLCPRSTPTRLQACSFGGNAALDGMGVWNRNAPKGRAHGSSRRHLRDRQGQPLLSVPITDHRNRASAPLDTPRRVAKLTPCRRTAREDSRIDSRRGPPDIRGHSDACGSRCPFSPALRPRPPFPRPLGPSRVLDSPCAHAAAASSKLPNRCGRERRSPGVCPICQSAAVAANAQTRITHSCYSDYPPAC